MLNWSGILIGLTSFIVIGVFHPVVIKCEYYFSDRVWPVFLAGASPSAPRPCSWSAPALLRPGGRGVFPALEHPRAETADPARREGVVPPKPQTRTEGVSLPLFTGFAPCGLLPADGTAAALRGCVGSCRPAGRAGVPFSRTK